jgi:hypothetical protein
MTSQLQGNRQHKENEIAPAKEDPTYDALTGNVMSAAVFGESAIASGLIHASWKDEHGTAQRGTFRFLAILQKQQEGGSLWRRNPPDLKNVNDFPSRPERSVVALSGHFMDVNQFWPLRVCGSAMPSDLCKVDLRFFRSCDQV